jgi:hypothetical protein
LIYYRIFTKPLIGDFSFPQSRLSFLTKSPTPLPSAGLPFPTAAANYRRGNCGMVLSRIKKHALKYAMAIAAICSTQSLAQAKASREPSRRAH